MNKTRIYLVLQLLALTSFAQEKVWVGKNKKILNFQFHGTYVLPGGDFADRFNSFTGLGTGALLKTTHNVLLGVEGSYYFGNNVKPSNILSALVNNNLEFINTNSGSPATISLGMRGFSVLGKGGYLFPVSSRNRNSGISIMLGGGLVMHKLNISVVQNNVPALTESKKAGYDRYSSGWAFNQFVGYHHQSHNRRVNFYIGAELMQAQTYNRRGFNYDQMKFDKDKHNDYYFGIRLGWMIPVYINTKVNDDEFIFH